MPANATTEQFLTDVKQYMESVDVIRRRFLRLKRYRSENRTDVGLSSLAAHDFILADTSLPKFFTELTLCLLTISYYFIDKLHRALKTVPDVAALRQIESSIHKDINRCVGEFSIKLTERKKLLNIVKGARQTEKPFVEAWLANFQTHITALIHIGLLPDGTTPHTLALDTLKKIYADKNDVTELAGTGVLHLSEGPQNYRR